MGNCAKSREARRHERWSTTYQPQRHDLSSSARKRQAWGPRVATVLCFLTNPCCTKRANMPTRPSWMAQTSGLIAPDVQMPKSSASAGALLKHPATGAYSQTYIHHKAATDSCRSQMCSISAQGWLMKEIPLGHWFSRGQPAREARESTCARPSAAQCSPISYRKGNIGLQGLFEDQRRSRAKTYFGSFLANGD